MNIINDFKFKLDRNLVLKAMNCYEESDVYEDVCETYDFLVDKFEESIEPKAIFEFQEKPAEYVMDDVKYCSHVVYCLLTLGRKVTEETEKHFNSGEYLEGMLLDTMSDILLDEYAGQLYKKLCAEAKEKGFGLTCKLSPGNADFHISNQKFILDKLKGTEILGVSVTEGFMLNPLKSVSYIYGADKSLDIPIFDHECSRCISTTCKMRKEPYRGKNTGETVVVTAISSGKETSFEASKNKSLLQILIENNIKVQSPCSGNGTCGKCKVRILRGNIKKLDNNSRLSKELLEKGWCLACSTFPEEDCVISVDKEEEGINILEAFDDSYTEFNPAYKAVKVEINKSELKGKSLTEVINSKTNCKYTFSIKALKKLSTVINSYSPNKDNVYLEGEDDFNLVVKDSTVLDVCKVNDTKVYGIAVDIGTTTIALNLIDLVTGKSIKSYSMLNSQRQFGSDVISRIQYTNGGKLDSLNDCIKNDLIKAIKELCNASEILPENIYSVVLAGNTTMLYFLLGLPCESLALFPFNTVTTEMLEYKYGDVFEDKLLDCNVTFLPGVSAYVGADIVSGMLQCSFDKLEKISILIDVGTNGEMAIGSKESILCLATAAGPAFEGANITYGTASVRGAISSVEIYEGKVSYKTLGNAEPEGICGSAVIDITAECIKNNIIDETGRFDEDEYEEGYIKIAQKKNGEEIVFNQKDIREVQLAKSAIRSGIEILMKEYKCSADNIDKVFMAGGFGNHMSVENAAIIGMIPEDLKSKVKVVGNSSLGGAVSYLLNEKNKERMDYILGKTKYIDISSNPDFNDLFIENMLF